MILKVEKNSRSVSKALMVNGVAKFKTPPKNSLLIGYQDALRVLFASQRHLEGSIIPHGELKAVITHWLQSPKQSPVFLDESYRDQWLGIIHDECIYRSKGLLSSTPIKLRPVHIDFGGLPFEPAQKPKFTFIDLFAGIGGFRIALQNQGGKCVFSSEWDKHAKETYFENYGEVPFGDICQFTSDNLSDKEIDELIPNHDILAGGFPCQPFSQAGLQLGFNDARGTLFFDILRIVKAKRPRVLFLENVKRLKGHDKGRTFAVICNSLESLGYKVHAKVLRASDFGVPQNRERIFIVAFNDEIDFEFPKRSRNPLYGNVGDILENDPNPKYTISDKLLSGHRRRLQEHRQKGNGFGFSVFDKDSLRTNTISARYYKDGSEILIRQSGNPRKLTPRECARLQGFPEHFKYANSDVQAYRQFGNSVAVPVVSAIAESIYGTFKLKKTASSTASL